MCPSVMGLMVDCPSDVAGISCLEVGTCFCVMGLKVDHVPAVAGISILEVGICSSVMGLMVDCPSAVAGISCKGGWDVLLPLHNATISCNKIFHEVQCLYTNQFIRFSSLSELKLYSIQLLSVNLKNKG